MKEKDELTRWLESEIGWTKNHLKAELPKGDRRYQEGALKAFEMVMDKLAASSPLPLLVEGRETKFAEWAGANNYSYRGDHNWTHLGRNMPGLPIRCTSNDLYAIFSKAPSAPPTLPIEGENHERFDSRGMLIGDDSTAKGEYFTYNELKLIRTHVEILIQNFKPNSETSQHSIDELKILLPKLPELDSKRLSREMQHDIFINECSKNKVEGEKPEPNADDKFIRWLDEENEKAANQVEIENRKMDPYFAWEGRAQALEQAKEMYLSLRTVAEPEAGENQEVPELPGEIQEMIVDNIYLTPIHPNCHNMDKQQIWDCALGKGAEDMYRCLQAEISSLRQELTERTHELVKNSEAAANAEELVAGKDAEIELLRKNGATLPDILAVIEWCVKSNIHKDMWLWRLDGHLMGYNDKRIVEVFLEESKNHKAE